MQIAALGSPEVILIVVAVLVLVFGSSKLPKIARGLGTAKTEFEKGIKEGHGAESAPAAPPAPTAPAAPAVPAEDKNQTDSPAP